MNYKELFMVNGKIPAKRTSEKYLIKHNLLDVVVNYGYGFNTEVHNLSFKIQCMVVGITEAPTCEVCGEYTFRNKDVAGIEFRRFCSIGCSTKVRSDDHYSKRDAIAANEMRKQTMLDKYGYEYNSQRPEIKKILSITRTNYHLSVDTQEKLTDKKWMYNEYIINNRTAVDIADELGVYYGTVISYCKSHGFKIKQTSNYSLYEVELSRFLTDLGVYHERNDKILGRKEVDIHIPSKNICIEIDGLYWHSYDMRVSVKERKKSLQKSIECEDQGLQLLRIFEDEWILKRDIWKSIIKVKLGICNNKIHARKTNIMSVSSLEAKEFLNNNHLQGFVAGKHYGLYHNGELAQLMTIGKSRFEKDKIELLRLCTIKDTVVVGGLTKLLKFINIDLVSYADRRYSNKEAYHGFIFEKYTDIGYFWTDKKIRINRFNTQKNKLSKLLGSGYDESKSEFDNMIDNKYRIIYDCGQCKFTYYS